MTVLRAISPEEINREIIADIILVCDHAVNDVPPGISLGLTAEQMQDHIALDIGAAEVTRRIAALMKIPAILAKTSRLVIDCNRHEQDASLVPKISDNTLIPGNQNLEHKDITARIAAFYDPFHSAIDRQIKRHLAAGKRPLVMAVHSFTPIYQGSRRSVDVGFLWNKDPRLAQAMIGLFERETDLIVGDNIPYSGKDLYHTMEIHGAKRGLAQTTLEIRNDHLRKAADIEAWSRLLADMLDECCDRPELV